MNLQKKEDTKFFVLTLLLSIVIGASFTAVIVKNHELKKAKDHFLLTKARLIAILENEPTISEENKAASINNVQEISQLSHNWSGFNANSNTPTTPIECYLNLQNTVESLKTAMKSANITLDPKCCLGFEKYLETEKLPTQESIGKLYEQSQIITMLVNMLIEARPQEIVFIKNPDHQHLKIHDVFSSDTIQLSFIGTTETLRSFVNKTQELVPPTFIRNIEINSYSNDNYCVFSVILEILKLNDEVHFQA